MIEVAKLFNFVLAAIIVILGVYVSMKVYSSVTGYKVVEEKGEEIIDDKLRRLVSWRTYYLTNFKMIKIDQGVFQMLLEFNFNNFPELLKLIAKTKNSKLRQQNDLSVFNYIVNLSDQSTDDIDPLEPQIVKPAEISAVDDFTRQLMGIRSSVQVQEKAPPASSQEIQDLFAFLDMLETNVNVRNRFKVEIQDRIMTMKIPLKVVGKDPEKTMLRFDPNYFFGTKTLYGNILELYVYADKLTAFAMSNPNKTLVVPFNG